MIINIRTSASNEQHALSQKINIIRKNKQKSKEHKNNVIFGDVALVVTQRERKRERGSVRQLQESARKGRLRPLSRSSCLSCSATRRVGRQRQRQRQICNVHLKHISNTIQQSQREDVQRKQQQQQQTDDDFKKKKTKQAKAERTNTHALIVFCSFRVVCYKKYKKKNIEFCKAERRKLMSASETSRIS